MASWYTADTHFGHENVIPFCGRPFRHAGHMDSVLIENMWKVVQPEDNLWIIGDFAFGPKAKDPDYLNILFGQLPGAAKHLIIGNHDLAPTLELPWDSISHLTEVPDGEDGLCHTLYHYPMITWNGARKTLPKRTAKPWRHWKKKTKGARRLSNLREKVSNLAKVGINCEQ